MRMSVEVESRIDACLVRMKDGHDASMRCLCLLGELQFVRL
ncbi:MAG: hypothetical protein OJF51_004244 [Nitrospira sp.]|jgi:hypothetical protein|nr:MAG: hypothetical protein OJF51_004244 [Nitrospira sp.]